MEKKPLKENLKGVVKLNNFDKKISSKVKNYLDENVEFSTEEREKIQLKIQGNVNKSNRFQPKYWTVLASAVIIFLVLSLSFLKNQMAFSKMSKLTRVLVMKI